MPTSLGLHKTEKLTTGKRATMTNQPFQENCKDKAAPPPNYSSSDNPWDFHGHSWDRETKTKTLYQNTKAGRKLPVISFMSGFPRSGHSLQGYTNHVRKKEKQTSNQPNLYPPLLHGDTTQLFRGTIKKKTYWCKKSLMYSCEIRTFLVY